MRACSTALVLWGGVQHSTAGRCAAHLGWQVGVALAGTSGWAARSQNLCSQRVQRQVTDWTRGTETPQMAKAGAYRGRPNQQHQHSLHDLRRMKPVPHRSARGTMQRPPALKRRGAGSSGQHRAKSHQPSPDGAAVRHATHISIQHHRPGPRRQAVALTGCWHVATAPTGGEAAGSSRKHYGSSGIKPWMPGSR